MSISSLGVVSAFAVLAFTSPSFAIGVYSTTSLPLSPIQGVAFTQAGGAISESDLRRIHHYSAQTLVALNVLGTAAIPSNQDIDILGGKVRRLTDAGQRSGLTLEQTANYFSAYVAENNSGALPGFLLGSNGQIDSQKLLRSVENFSVNAELEGMDNVTLRTRTMGGNRVYCDWKRANSRIPKPSAFSCCVIRKYAANTGGFAKCITRNSLCANTG